MAFSYAGIILRVDLSQGSVSREPTSSYSGAFLGGRGINTKLLYDGSRPEDDALDAASPLIFGAGPLSGTPIPAGRVEVTARSPRGVGVLGCSNFGGYFGPELKQAGYDHIVVTGKADRPVYLWIRNDQVEIRDASGLWGRDAYETQAMIRSELDPEAQIACIGPAGENGVRFATIQHGLGSGASRTGVGAVMGSKKLKAIVVRGNKGIKLANPERFLAIAEQLKEDLYTHPSVPMIRKYGIAGLSGCYHSGVGGGQQVEQMACATKYNPKRMGCFGCPVQCRDLYPPEAKGGGGVGCEFVFVPFSTVGNSDPDVGLEAGLLCQRYGIDMCTSLHIIAWLMQLYERGLITAKVTDGIPMEWGSGEAIFGMLRKMVYREGFGDVLADGMAQAAESLGGEAEYLAHSVKGLPTMYLGIAHKPSAALLLAVGIRGDTMKGTTFGFDRGFGTLSCVHDEATAARLIEDTRRFIKTITPVEGADDELRTEGKAAIVAYAEDATVLADCMGTCKYHGVRTFGVEAFTRDYMADLFSAASGLETSVDDLAQYAQRVRNLERAYEVVLGVRRETEVLPKGVSGALDPARLEEMKSEYYALRGWDVATGVPTRETLEKMSLGDVAQDLKARGIL